MIKIMMTREIGDSTFPLWLLGDSNPTIWANRLDSPLDPRHPVRHSIVTPILDGVQDIVYRSCGLRIETHGLYIRNAVADVGLKPKDSQEHWGEDVCRETDELKKLLVRNVPPIILTFGAFSFEFARRAMGCEPAWHYKHWDTKSLGEAFRSAVKGFSPDRANLFPLLHITISRGKFIEAHDYFTGTKGGNYFEFASKELAGPLIAHRKSPRLERLWISRQERATTA